MSWLNGLSSTERQEIEDDLKESFHTGVISENEFRIQAGKLGLNATDIQELVDFYRPEPPENDDDDNR